MSDARLREHERRAREGDREAMALLREAIRERHRLPSSPWTAGERSEDPRRHPQPGDLLTQDGHVVRRVLEVGPDFVRFDLPGMELEKPKRVARETWDRWARRARSVADRDVKPEKATPHRDLKPQKILDQDRAALAAILDLEQSDGWCRAGATVLRADARLSHGAWQRAVARLEVAGLLERERVGKGDHYRLTARGSEIASEAKAERHPADRPTTGPRGPINQPTWADRLAHRPTEGGRGEALVGSSPSPNPKTEKNNEPTNEPAHAGQDDRPTDRPTGPRPAHDRPRRVVVVEHVHRLSDEDRALLGAWLASRSTLPALSPAALPPEATEADPEERRPAPSSDPRPEPDHPPPPCTHCGHPTMALVNGPRGWFWGCPLWRVKDCPGLSLAEARAAWLEAQRRAELERRREEERAERERERLAALNDDRPSLLSDPASLDRIIAAASRKA